MECALCGNKVKTLSQYVINRMVKKYVDIVGDYAFVSVKRDREKCEVNIKVSESDSGRFAKPITMNDSLWDADYDELEVVMLKYNSSMNFIEKGEMEELIKKHMAVIAEVEV